MYCTVQCTVQCIVFNSHRRQSELSIATIFSAGRHLTLQDLDRTLGWSDIEIFANFENGHICSTAAVEQVYFRGSVPKNRHV